MNNEKHLTGNSSSEEILEKQKYSSPVINVVGMSCDIITTSDGVNWEEKWGPVVEEDWE